MSQFENIFKVTRDSIELNKPELRGHPVFKNMLGNDKTQKQDAMFIYLMGHPKSMYSHLMGVEKLKQVKKHVQRPVEWQPPAALMAAVGAYVEHINITPTGKSFLAANKSLYEMGADINEIVENNNYLKNLMRSKITMLQSSQMGAGESDTLVNECRVLIQAILENQKSANAIIKQLPDVIATVEKIGDNWANEGSGAVAIYGGGTLGNRE